MQLCERVRNVTRGPLRNSHRLRHGLFSTLDIGDRQRFMNVVGIHVDALMGSARWSRSGSELPFVGPFRVVYDTRRRAPAVACAVSGDRDGATEPGCRTVRNRERLR